MLDKCDNDVVPFQQITEGKVFKSSIARVLCDVLNCGMFSNKPKVLFPYDFNFFKCQRHML